MPPILFRNARIHAPGEPTAFLVENGCFLWLGETSSADQLLNTAANWRVVDLQGHWVAPAFVDAHLHLFETGLAIGLGDDRKFDKVHLSGGWDEISGPPAIESLPSALPAYVARVDLHSAVVNEALLRLNPVIQSLDGYSTNGLVSGPAHVAAREAALSLLTASEALALELEALRQAASVGLAAVHEMAGPAITGFDRSQRLQQAVRERSDLPEVALWWGELHGFAAARELGAVGCGGDLALDGSIGSRTANFTEPYVGGTLGLQYLTQEEIAEHLLAGTKLGVPTSFHAIGDAALRDYLAAVATVRAQVGDARFAAVQHQVEHAPTATEADFEQLLAANVAWSTQPQFDARWGGSSGLYAERLGSTRAADLHNFKIAAQLGVPLVLGSDSPVTALDPWRTVFAAQQGGTGMGLRAAFAAHTATAYRRAGRGEAAGLAVGAAATFAVWDAPELSVPAVLAKSSWSTDPRSKVLPLPTPGTSPHCLLTVRQGELLFSSGEIEW